MEQKNKRPVFLVVDMDEGYVNALEIRIIQKYINKADLEFITDRIYLQEYLKTDPVVAVLVVGESMYSKELQQLMPVYTFVLMDEMGNEKLGDQIYGIFRYSSGQNILDTIADKVPETLFQEDESNVLESNSDDKFSDLNSNMEVILVTAASGGVGKTTVALGLAFIAADDERRAMYFNMDCLPNFDRWLEKKEDEFGNQILEMNQIFSDEMRVEDKLDCLCEIIRSEEYDLIIIDTDINDWKLQNKIFERANLILQITGNSNSNIYATNKLYYKLDPDWIEKSVYVCGNSGEKLRSGREEASEFTIEKRISHIEEYETLTINDLRSNEDLLQLYQMVKNKCKSQ